MFGLGTWEIVMILGVGLIVLGPDKLPTVARKLGKSVRDLRRAAGDFTREIQLDGLDKPETWLPPDGAQPRGQYTVEDLAEDDEAMTEESLDSPSETMVVEAEHAPLDDPTDPSVDADSQEAAPYAGLYDPRQQRKPNEEKTTETTHDEGEPPAV